MYKLLLSWRYLRSRYIALASIISVTLGVATLIIVNSVMAGFTQEMQKRLNGILSDIVFESHNLNGFADPDHYTAEIRKVIGPELAGISSTVAVPALLNFEFRGRHVTRQINLIGIDEPTYASVSDFGKYLLHPENQRQLSFLLREDGYAPGRKGFPPSGWVHRRLKAEFERELRREAEALERTRREIEQRRRQAEADVASAGRSATDDSSPAAPLEDPYAATVPVDPLLPNQPQQVFDPGKEQRTGVILGIAVGSIRYREPDTGQVRDVYLCRIGDDVQISFPTSSVPPQVESDSFTVVDFYESKMSEYDSNFAFVPLPVLQNLRGMVDPLSGITSVTSIQIKLRPGADLNQVRDRLRRRFPAEKYPGFHIQTWRDLQGPLLAAVQLETTILNILLFLIIAVAGFGILATFFMIVVEKTRDIGILKALGAPSGGVMSIFLAYGLALGIVGSGVGMLLGLVFVAYINEIADGLEWLTGREVFDPTVYYFQEIPAITQPPTVALVVVGAVFIAVMASVLPALRAARLHPVEALRYE